MRRTIAQVLLAVGVVACATPAPTAAPVPTSIVDPTGILLVGVEEQIQAGPVTEEFADALEAAVVLAEANGDDLGYPWIDQLTGELVLSAVTPRGRELIDAAAIALPHRVRDVMHGAAELQRIQDDVLLLGERGVPGAEGIYLTLPDYRDNRALIVISAMSRPLLEYLAEHYPVDAIAVQVDPDGASRSGP